MNALSSIFDLAPNRSSSGMSDGPSAGERAGVLYANAPNSLAAHMMVSVVVVLTVSAPSCARPLVMWLAAMLGVLALRTIDVAVLQPARVGRASEQTGRFGAGALATAALWAAFPLLFFPALGMPEQLAAAAMMVATAAFGPAILAPSPALTVVCCVAQAGPAAVMLLTFAERETMSLGLLGLLALPAAIASALRTHRSLFPGPSGAAETGSGLSDPGAGHGGKPRGREAAKLARELAEARSALQQVNALLESRIFERDADLARQSGERERHAETLARLVSTDPLTRLANRAAFVDHLSDMLQTAGERNEPVSLLFIDLDKFKQVNDVRGHVAGDHVLRTAASLLDTCVPGASKLARWGGDEFVIAISGADAPDAAVALARRLRSALKAPITAGQDLLRIDATIGVASFPTDATTHDELIRAADVAMYEGKKEGGGRVKLFDPALAREVAERHMIEQALRDAIDNGDFSLVFQPIVSAETGRCEAFEALLRWVHPTRGAISPAVFIPVAEQSGQIGAIGRWVLREACMAAAAWPRGAPPVTVNVSVEQVQSGTLLADVQSALSASGLPVNRLQLEITESLFAQDQARVSDVIEALRAMGVRILMDDFGAGYSSLACLSSLPLDVIKIDKSFVHATGKDGDAFIKAILLIARSLQLRVIAEGIETPGQRDTMRSLGVEMLQGYWFARPMRDDQVGEWLEAHSESEMVERG